MIIEAEADPSGAPGPVNGKDHGALPIPAAPAGAPRGESVRGDDPAPAPGWHKARPLLLKRSATAEGALAAIVHAGLVHLRANEACVLARAHDEGVHQMRVALRRLRSGLALFAPMLPADQVAYLTGELKWLIASLGPARDLDVFLAETLPPVVRQFPKEPRLAELAKRATAARDEAYRVAAAAITSARYTGLIMLLGAWADGRRWREPLADGAHADLARPVVEVATGILDDHYARVIAANDHFAQLDSKERHKLRIEIKKLRYACEFFFSLFPRRRQRAFQGALKTLQDRLGVSNDLDVARRLLLGLVRAERGRARGRSGYAAGLVIGWHGHVSDGREGVLRANWAHFAALPPFWPSQARPPATPAADAAPADATVN
jgi:CHAD domain-containing protein